MHTLDFVHKSVRPENVIGFDDGCSGPGSFFLIRFQQVRSADGKTYLRGDSAWEKNIYRHPDRQGPYLEQAYSMQHDIYSLGVCLLEIGIWQSPLAYLTDRTVEGPAAAADSRWKNLGSRDQAPSKAI
ncbi:hypothetical protein LTR36_008349 [Oleoguttula mirabilis]|uniref:Protein kinase domain-containing protein n=1 Tax=Oleoguttula mirabilis TaxID=1507867 RepID=A0AAV9J7X7_9PEZI|nr:hypothetical protein LTR36_008349 [Oleoguttula mirabilis]